MRRTDEAFKKEIFRRYGVQKRNRRNLRLLATAPLIFCVFIAGVLLLPTILGMFDTAPAADDPTGTTTVKEEFREALPEEHPLAKYLNRPIEEVRCFGGEYYTWHSCTENEIAEILTRILKLSISETDTPDFSSGQSMPYLSFKFTDTSTVQLSLDPSGSIQLSHYPGDGTLRTILAYYQIPADEMAEFASYLRILGSPLSHFDEYLQKPAQEIVARGVQIKAGADRLQKALQELTYTEAEAIDTPLSSALSVEIYFSDEDLRLLFFPDGSVSAHHRNPNQQWYFTIPEEELSALASLVDQLVQENSVDLASLIPSSEIITTLKLQDTYNYTTAITISDSSQIAEVLSTLRPIEALPIPYLELEAMGYTLSFTDSTGITTQLSFDYDDYTTVSWKQWYKTGLQGASFFTISKDDAEAILAYFQQLEAKWISQITPPAPETYLLDSELATVSVRKGQNTYQNSVAHQKVLLNTLRSALSGATPVCDWIWSASDYTVRFEMQSIEVEIYVYPESHRVIVNILYSEPLSNVYCFPLEAETMKELETAIENFIKGTLVTPPETEESAAPTTLEECLKQTVVQAKISKDVEEQFPTYKYTDSTSITALMSLLAEQNWLPAEELYSYSEIDGMRMEFNFQTKGYFTLLFHSSGWVSCSVYDGKTYHKSFYQLLAEEVALMTAEAKRYFDPPPSDKTPLMSDVMDNAALQKLLAALDVTVQTEPQEMPDAIKAFLTDQRRNSPAPYFFTCDQVYFSPDELSLFSTLYNYYTGSKLTQAEKEALIRAGVNEAVVENIDCCSFTQEDVRNLLANLAYMPSFADDLHGALMDTGYTYLPETDRYYHFVSDTNQTGPAYNIRLYHTSREDTVIALYSYYTAPDHLAAVAFRIVDGEYRLYGYTPLSTEA
ncbi:MAG: hypothetical protein IJX47_00400 [Clostridia bacterium]|nr:hypothetical protein [Clostridia bacterium]